MYCCHLSTVVCRLLMDETKIIDKILITTYTLTGLKRRIKALKSRLSEHFFGGDTNKSMVMEEVEWLNTYGVQFLKDFQKESFQQTFTRIEKIVADIKPLTIYLSFLPGEEQIKQIGSQVRDSYSQKIVIDIKHDPELVGGCAFIWNGVYKDYSIRAKIQQDKEKILSSFKSYLASKGQ